MHPNTLFMYNGRDGVVTEDNGLIYMRARYYSPELRRFINADIIHGNISDPTSLNRYSYVNGNPVSFVDPFGLSAENHGSFETHSIFDIINKIKNDKNTASNIFRNVLDELLNLKNVCAVSSEVTIPFQIGVNVNGTFSVSATAGNSDVEISSVVFDQLEILGVLSFDIENGSISFGTDNSISVEYTYDIDNYNTVSASISANPDVSLSISYGITTKDANEKSVSTNFSITYSNDNRKKDKQPQLAPEYLYSYERQPSKSKDSSWLRTLGGLAVLGFAFVSDAFGIVFDDAVLVPLGSALLGF